MLHKKTEGLRRIDGDSAPRHRPVVSAAPRPTARPVSAPSGGSPLPVFPEIAGVTWTPDGFLADPKAWNRELAEVIAADLGIAPLSERHWQAIDAARRIHAETGSSPNIRKLTGSSGVDTRELYALFPKAPGKTVARIAGIPKPAGCL